MPGWILTLCLDYIIKDQVRQLRFIIRSITVFFYFMDIIYFYGETDNQLFKTIKLYNKIYRCIIFIFYGFCVHVV